MLNRSCSSKVVADGMLPGAGTYKVLAVLCLRDRWPVWFNVGNGSHCLRSLSFWLPMLKCLEIMLLHLCIICYFAAWIDLILFRSTGVNRFSIKFSSKTRFYDLMIASGVVGMDPFAYLPSGPRVWPVTSFWRWGAFSSTVISVILPLITLNALTKPAQPVLIFLIICRRLRCTLKASFSLLFVSYHAKDFTFR